MDDVDDENELTHGDNKRIESVATEISSSMPHPFPLAMTPRMKKENSNDSDNKKTSPATATELKTSTPRQVVLDMKRLNSSRSIRTQPQLQQTQQTKQQHESLNNSNLNVKSCETSLEKPDKFVSLRPLNNETTKVIL